MPGRSSPNLWSTTTPCVCTAPLAMWRPRTNWKAEPRRSGNHVTRNWKPRAKGAGRNEHKRPCRPWKIRLATDDDQDQKQSVRPEDRALLGSNPSAAVDSNTAGLGGSRRPGRPPAGSTSKRKIHQNITKTKTEKYLTPQPRKAHFR